MPQDANRLIWIDLEMTGLKPETDRILEVALVITDHALDIVAQAPVHVIHQDDAVLDAMDSWNQTMCGNSICQDRRFLARFMPSLEDWFHYRNLDVSTLKELARRWKPELLRGVPKEGKHEALADILESIAELRYYRDNFLKL